MTGNPPPRRALPRTSPLLPGDAHVVVPALPTDAAREETTGVETSTPLPATGRDLLIRGAHDAPAGTSAVPTSAPGKKGRPAGTVPSLRELMPDSAPRVVAPDPSPADEGRRTKKRQALEPAPVAHGGRSDKQVEVVLTMPKGLRKRLRARADEMGMTVEQMVTQLAEVWIDG